MAALSGDGYAQALYDEMSIAVEAGWMAGSELITLAADIGTGFGPVPAETLTAIQDKADAFAFLVNSREQAQIYSLIDTAIADGQTVGALAGAIQSSFADGYHVMDDSGNPVRTLPTEDWSMMVARTELNRAQTFGQMAVYQSAGIEKIRYQSNHGATVCDECSDDDGEVFTIDDQEAPDIPQHPNCCCCWLPADEDVESPLVDRQYPDQEDAAAA